MKKIFLKIPMIFAIIFSFVLILGVVILLKGQIESIPTNDIIANCKVEQKEYKNRKIYIATSNQHQEEDKIILYLHGGSYVGNLTKEHWRFIRNLVIDTKSTIIVPDYPLTPNYNYEDVFEFMEPLYQEIVKKVPKEKLIVMGDSAGGGLSLALIEKMGTLNEMMPSKTILISPWLDVRLENPEIKEVEKVDPTLSLVNLKVAGISYAGKDGMNSYLVNPIDGPLEKLENIIIYTGTYDILNPDVKVLQERAKEKQVEIKVEETEGAQHIWILKKEDETVYRAKEDYEKLIQELKGESES